MLIMSQQHCLCWQLALLAVCHCHYIYHSHATLTTFALAGIFHKRHGQLTSQAFSFWNNKPLNWIKGSFVIALWSIKINKVEHWFMYVWMSCDHLSNSIYYMPILSQLFPGLLICLGRDSRTGTTLDAWWWKWLKKILYYILYRIICSYINLQNT